MNTYGWTTTAKVDGMYQVGKGQRSIVVHAGRVKGWVDGADYHEMNTEHYMEWFTQQLLLNVGPNFVIIVNNSTYHIPKQTKDKVPTATNRKYDIKQWLNRQNIRYADISIKKDATGKSMIT